MKQEVSDAVSAAPPITVAGLTLWGITLQDWVYLLTAIYTVMLITQHVWVKWVKPWREARRA